GIGIGIVAWAWWARSFDARQVLANYRYVMRRNSLAAIGLWAYFGFRLLVS
ncbi:MAG: hypothetical protein JO057_13530, partial [Chloroflexi bacterium]|nr:hypothetical protein [Chloroflexota bacterium]